MKSGKPSGIIQSEFKGAMPNDVWGVAEAEQELELTND